MRALAALALAVLLAAPTAWAGARSVVTSLVVCTPTVSHVATANINRTALTVQNVGTLHVNVGAVNPGFDGRSTHSGAFAGLTVHVGSSVEFRDYQGGLLCQTQPGTGSTAVEVLEEVK